MNDSLRIGLVGYGEVGQILAADLRERGVREIVAWDILFPDTNSVPSRALAGGPVRAAAGMAEALASTKIVISAVTAAQDVEAARAAAGHLMNGTYYLDLNSASPGAKREAAAIIEARGGRYVEAAVMAPVPPRRIATPMLLGGPHAEEFLLLARRLGFTGAEVFAVEIGRASAAKMCRSVMIKGLEALLTESLLGARRYGVEGAVLDSLQGFLPQADWPKIAHYMMSRSLLHGRRRAEEMREVVRTLAEVGIEPWMSRACVERQDWAADHSAAAVRETLEPLLDAILEPEKPERSA